MWNTCKINEHDQEESIVASNPCSEYMFLNDTACNLASLNLMGFMRNGTFEVEDYLHCISLVQLVLEATIYAGTYPTKDIAYRSYLYRTTGMGYCNLGTLLLSNWITYAADEASDLGAYLMSLMTARCYKVSALLAKEVGQFAVYEPNKSTIKNVLNNHKTYALDGKRHTDNPRYIHDFKVSNKLTKIDSHQLLEEEWTSCLNTVDAHGLRNAQVTLLAPTGTISFAMDAKSTGIEPLFNHLAYKKVVDGSYMVLLSDATLDALSQHGFTATQVDEIQDHLKKAGSLYKAPHLTPQDYKVLQVANDSSEELTLSTDAHLVMMAKITSQLSGAISKTVNLPHTATVDAIEDVYYKAWKMGIKAITVYRDNSKASQPLTLKQTENEVNPELSDLQKENEELKEELARVKALLGKESTSRRNKPEGIRSASTHELIVGDIRLYITVTKDAHGNPIEVFTNAGKQGEFQRGLLESVSRLISIGLQYNVPIDEIRKILRHQKYQPSGFVGGKHPYIKQVDSISDAISKVLDIECGDYTYCQVRNKTTKKPATAKPTEKVYGMKCSRCGSTNLMRAGSCYVCECGETTGCS
jgi:ribonucleoside-diphosphate reductase alpha chain